MLRLLDVASKQVLRFLRIGSHLRLKVDVIGIWSCEPSLSAGIVTCFEVVESRFVIPFLEGELLLNEEMILLIPLGNCFPETLATNAIRSENKQNPNGAQANENEEPPTIVSIPH
jgi:hypothetical protein